MRMPEVRGGVIQNVVSIMANDCAGDEKPQRGAPEAKEKKTAGRNGCCLFRGAMMVVRRDDMQTLHDLA
jgi:hypothetical protein